MSQPSYQVTNPASGEVSDQHPFATDAEVESALAGATASFAGWRDRPLEERIAVLRRISGLFTERRQHLAELINKEMGKAVDQGLGEVDFCASIFDFYADNAAALLAPKPVAGRTDAQVEPRAVGPVLGVMPWNYPYYQVARFAAPNFSVGNTVLLKHAENCPTSALALADLFRDAGVPEGVYANLFATFDQVAGLIGDGRVRGVSVTGSERAGAAVASTAGANLKKVVLELGGSDPFIVLDAQDVDAVAGSAWDFRIDNVGQACNSNKRMIVMDDLYDDFVAGLTRRASALRPRLPGADDGFSPMVSKAAAEALLAQVQDAVDKGAVLHAGGRIVPDTASGAFFEPTVLTGVTPDMRAFSEELFGPVAVVYKVSSEDEAVALANAVDFGLGGSVWSADESRALKVGEQLDVGMVAINAPAAEDADLPFGGTKRSGFGRELGALGIEEFVNKRLVYVARS